MRKVKEILLRMLKLFFLMNLNNLYELHEEQLNIILLKMLALFGTL